MLHWSREIDGRQYTAFICKDIFNDWTVVKAWGGKGRPKLNQRIIYCCDFDEAVQVLANIAKRRATRGYRLVSADNLYGTFKVISANDHGESVRDF